MDNASPATIAPPMKAKRKLASGAKIKLEMAIGRVYRKSERPFESCAGESVKVKIKLRSNK